MALNIKGLARGTGGNNFQVAENVGAVFSEVKLAEPGKSDPDKDVMVFTHLNDACGKKAGEMDQARLQFKKRPVVAEAPKKDARAPFSLMDHGKGKGMMKAAKPGETVYVLEGCYRDRVTGILNARYVRQVSPILEDSKHFTMPNVMAKVFNVKVDPNGVKKPYQIRVLADLDRAVRIGGSPMKEGEVQVTFDQMVDPAFMATLKGKPRFATFADAFRAALADQAAGNVGFTLRAIDPTEKSNPVDLLFQRRNKKVEKDGPDGKIVEWLPITNEEALEELRNMKDGDEPIGANWLAAIDAPNDAMFELIPQTRLSAGPMAAEKAAEQVAEAKADGKFSPKDKVSDRYHATVVDALGKSRSVACFVPSLAVIQRTGEDTDNWFVTETMPLSSQPAKFLDAELVTDNVPADIAKLYTDRALERGKFERKTEAAPAAAEEANTFGDDPRIEADAASTPRP